MIEGRSILNNSVLSYTMKLEGEMSNSFSITTSIIFIMNIEFILWIKRISLKVVRLISELSLISFFIDRF